VKLRENMEINEEVGSESLKKMLHMAKIKNESSKFKIQNCCVNGLNNHKYQIIKTKN